MKAGKAELLSLEVEANMHLRAKFPSRADRDIFITMMKAISSPDACFECVSNTEVVCKPPGAQS